ncbi:MAG: hypothetical protein ABIP14_12035, partial [Blastocatellia bacterium]
MVPTNKSVRADLEGDGDTFGRMIPVGLLLAMLFTALAFGAVEAWSVAVFGALIAALFLLWGVKCFVEKQLTLVVPATAWPLVALIVLGVLQSISSTDESGKRFAISMDIEATRLLLESLVV